MSHFCSRHFQSYSQDVVPHTRADFIIHSYPASAQIGRDHLVSTPNACEPRHNSGRFKTAQLASDGFWQQAGLGLATVAPV